MRNVVVDCRFAATPSGLGRFTRELTAALLASAPADTNWTFLVQPGQEPWWERDVQVRMLPVDVPHYSLTEQRAIPQLLRDVPCDVYLAPHFNAPIGLKMPFVVTVHDLILHRYPNAASPLKQLAYRLLMRAAVARSAAVLAVSPFVQGEVAAMYGQRVAAKTVATGEGASPLYSLRDQAEQDRVRQAYGLVRPFLLYVGNAKEHKNVAGLLEAFQLAKLSGTDLALVASGKEADAFAWPAWARRLKNVPEADLPALYSAAAACVTMSRYEGYCLPLVEALACGCPVVAPALTAIPDVVGGAEGVRLLPDISPATFAAAFQDLPKRPTPRALHSWDGPAEIVWSVLERVSRRS